MYVDFFKCLISLYLSVPLLYYVSGLLDTSIVIRGLRKIVVCSNFCMQQRYDAAISQYFVLNSEVQNNMVLFEFRYVLDAI